MSWKKNAHGTSGEKLRECWVEQGQEAKDKGGEGREAKLENRKAKRPGNTFYF